MIILDTNVLSAIMRPMPDELIVAWLNGQSRPSLWTTSITVLEIQSGIQIMPEGKRRSHLTKAFEIAITDRIGQRVAPFDTTAAQHSASLMASRHKMGRPVELRDTMIAGIALACHASLATRNVSHFDDLSVPVINPWEP
jgi:predicted nucleic acid-binding protein